MYFKERSVRNLQAPALILSTNGSPKQLLIDFVHIKPTYPRETATNALPK